MLAELLRIGEKKLFNGDFLLFCDREGFSREGFLREGFLREGFLREGLFARQSSIESRGRGSVHFPFKR